MEKLNKLIQGLSVVSKHLHEADELFADGFKCAKAIEFARWLQSDDCKYVLLDGSWESVDGSWESVDGDSITDEDLYIQFLKSNP
jgi:hypothetical protein